MNLDRRSFLLTATSASLLQHPLFGQTATQPAAPPAPAPEAPITDRTVALNGDSPPTTHEQELLKLQSLMSQGPYADIYLKGGAVTAFEQRVAALLGKPDAAFMPTGTLANNLAVRLLCGERKNLLIQHEAHLYQDEGEGPSLLSGLNMIPLAPGRACPSTDELAEALVTADHSAYFPTRVGAISLESPVRRQNGSAIPYAEAKKLTTLARSKGLGTHLDGSRLFLMSGSPGFAVKPYCALFDTVFVSIYKFMGAPFGAILAGPADLIAQARELRHTFGGLIYHGWMAALPALSNCDTFEARFSHARAAADELLTAFETAGGFTVHRTPDGTNIHFIDLAPARQRGFTERMEQADIRIAPLKDGQLKFWFNESILRRPTAELLAAFTG
jgi:threonine aldolase